MQLALDVRIDGFADSVGQLGRRDDQSVMFVYRQWYLYSPEAIPISLSLPLQTAPYGDGPTRAFFDNLLSERDGAMAAIMAREGIERSDVAGLLYFLGKDCAGAISILPEGAPPTKVPGNLAEDYVPLSDEQLAEIVRSLHVERRLPAGVQDPSPLAGVQSKIALTRLPDGRLAEPRPGSGAPTTHILKVPAVGQERNVVREELAMRICREQMPTASAAQVGYGGIPALLVERFDRRVDGNRVTRIHQEDFAQALGLPAELKYERRGREGRRFDVASVGALLDRTTMPVLAKRTFIAATMFDLLVGNADAHAKNHALLFTEAGSVEPAPRYDVLPTRIDPNFTDEHAYRIGQATRLDKITIDDLRGFLTQLGIRRAPAQDRILTQTLIPLSYLLTHELEVLEREGERLFADLVAANMRHLLPLVGLDVPEQARDRDAAIFRGGGWAS
jgi:serine/threonine-protein kinase HipA